MFIIRVIAVVLVGLRKKRSIVIVGFISASGRWTRSSRRGATRWLVTGACGGAVGVHRTNCETCPAEELCEFEFAKVGSGKRVGGTRVLEVAPLIKWEEKVNNFALVVVLDNCRVQYADNVWMSTRYVKKTKVGLRSES